MTIPAVHLIVVVPCYDEERRLPVDSFRRFASEGLRTEFIFVDDGSRDGTLPLLQCLAEADPTRFAVVALERNSGKAEAVRRGVLSALERKPDLVGFWDADLATPLSEIPQFTEIFTSRPEIDLVMGARVRLLGRRISRRPARHYIGRVGATLISSSLGIAIYDTQCGAKIFRVNGSLPSLFERTFLSRWIFDVEIIARMVSARGRDAAVKAIFELPVREWQDVGESKVRPHDFIRSLHDLWKIHRAYGKDQSL